MSKHFERNPNIYSNLLISSLPRNQTNTKRTRKIFLQLGRICFRILSRQLENFSVFCKVFSQIAFRNMIAPLNQYQLRHPARARTPLPFPHRLVIIYRERFHRETGFSVSQFTLVAVPFPVPVPVPFPFPDPFPDSGFPGFPYAPSGLTLIGALQSIARDIGHRFTNVKRPRIETGSFNSAEGFSSTGVVQGAVFHSPITSTITASLPMQSESTFSSKSTPSSFRFFSLILGL